MRNKKLKVALVHDYLVDFGGAERVLVALHEIYPQAPVYLAILDKNNLGKTWSVFQDWDLRVSWFQKLPMARKLISLFRFLLPLIWGSFDLSDYDLVISSSSWAMPRGVKTGLAKHICYCHTPPRFLYGYPDARRWTRFWPVRIYAAVVNHFLRFYDYSSSQRVDCFIANSKEVAGRIKKFYKKDSVVIHPPVDVEIPKRIVPGSSGQSQPFYLFAGRLYAYKHPELAIKACQKLARKLIVSGDGAMRAEVEKLASQSKDVDYLGRVTDDQLWRLYADCRAFIYPIDGEDFGMMPIEAASFGKPTIGYYSGGVKETILDGQTGVFFDQLTVDGLIKAVERLESVKIDPQDCRNWAEQFSTRNFKRKIEALVEKVLNEEKKEKEN